MSVGMLTPVRASLYPTFKGMGSTAVNFVVWHPLIPGLINTHGIPDQQMTVLKAMHLERALLVYGKLHKHHRRKEGKHHGCRKGGRLAFVAGYLPVRITRIKSDLPLEHRTHQPVVLQVKLLQKLPD
jgi:hypothetical protein